MFSEEKMTCLNKTACILSKQYDDRTFSGIRGYGKMMAAKHSTTEDKVSIRLERK